MKESILYLRVVKILKKIPSRLFLVLFAGYIIIPLLWMFSTTLRIPAESFKMPPAILPTSFNLENYLTVFTKVDMWLFTKNSFNIAFWSVFAQIVCSSMAAYAFARFRFPGKNFIFIAFLSSLMIPGVVMNIPRFITMSKLGLVDTHASLILPTAFSAMGIFLIRQNILTSPRSYDEAAYIDGASKLYCFTRIILPMAKPAIMVLAVCEFVGAWNDFFGPLIYLNTEKKMTLPLGLSVLRGTLNEGNEAAILAGVMLSLIPPVVFFCFGQRFLVEGMNLGGLKG